MYVLTLGACHTQHPREQLAQCMSFRFSVEMQLLHLAMEHTREMRVAHPFYGDHRVGYEGHSQSECMAHH